MTYVDGFVLPIPAESMEEYRQLAEKAGKVWMEHGALDYKECVIDHDGMEGVRSFVETAGAKKGETTVFAYIVYTSRAHRDEVNAKVMADPRIREHGPEKMPFDCKRMSYGGFDVIVDMKK